MMSLLVRKTNVQGPQQKCYVLLINAFNIDAHKGHLPI